MLEKWTEGVGSEQKQLAGGGRVGMRSEQKDCAVGRVGMRSEQKDCAVGRVSMRSEQKDCAVGRVGMMRPLEEWVGALGRRSGRKELAEEVDKSEPQPSEMQMHCLSSPSSGSPSIASACRECLSMRCYN